MITEERIPQFSHLLAELLKFTRIGLSVRDAGICAFFSTAEKYSKKPPTIRDMVTRSCGVNIDYFYNSISFLLNGNSTLFKEKFYTYIPKSWHKKFDEICNSFMTSGVNPPKNSPDSLARLIKRFAKSTPDEKREIINELSIFNKNH